MFTHSACPSISTKFSGSPSSGLKMEIVFKRRLVNELLTTYLPSFLLLLISYATTFFKPFYFEAAVTVNLTVMLVTTTLFVRWGSIILIFWCSYQMSSSQCDGKASSHFLRSFGGHLAHIRTTHPLCGGKTTFQFIISRIYHCITYYRWFSSQLLSFIMRMMSISIIMGSWEMSPSTRPRSQNRRWMWQKWSQMGRWYQTCLL